MGEWTKAGVSAGIGAAAGIIDQLVQNQDAKREAERGEKLPVMQQIGTYVNYGGFFGSILLTALGVLRGDNAIRAITASSVLAGRKGTWQATVRREAAWTPWRRDEAARQRALAEARKRGPSRQIGGAPTPINIPIISEEEILV